MKELLQTAGENLSFILTCLGIFAALCLLALLAERLMKTRRALGSARYISVVGVCAALSGVLMLLEIPLFFAPSFYKMDLSEIPALFCGFYLGPVAGVLCELLKVLMKLLFKGTTSAFVGDFANFAIGCSMVLPATILYHLRKSKRSAVAGLAVGTVLMTVFGSIFNAIYLLPKFAVLYGIPLDAIISMGTAVNPGITSVSTLVLFAVVPFNLLKGAIDSVLTFLLYKRVEHALFRKRSS
ncbi:MAG: ECF transporter S component [Oscillospiraceae bacterium]|nr:ECF transporter S component [Oscillospiraceae bacterium]